MARLSVSKTRTPKRRVATPLSVAKKAPVPKRRPSRVAVSEPALVLHLRLYPEHGVAAALVGVLLQSCGFLIDAFLHRQDPTLAARESVLSLQNPGHLIVALGVTISATGIIWLMGLLAWRERSGRMLAASLLLILVLLLVLLRAITT